jgi:hypothetical protein
MDQSMARKADEMMARLSGSLTRWVLGVGLLSLHATVFTISMIAMVLWNIYSAPSNIWIDDVFRRWGAVLAFHAISVAAGLTAWRLLRAEHLAMDSHRADWSRSERPVRRPTFTPRAATNGWHPTALVQSSSAHRYAESAHKAEEVAKRALSTSAVWSAAVARRTIHVVATTASKWTKQHDEVNGSTPAVTDPTKTWPESPVRHRTEDEEFISRFAAKNSIPAPDSVVQNAGPADDVVLDASGISNSDEARTSSAPAVGKEPGQTWVEAATFAWHVPRDSDGGSPHHENNGHETITPETTPAENDDQPPTQ